MEYTPKQWAVIAFFMPLGIFVKSFVMMKLYEWLIIPVLHTPSLTLSQCAALYTFYFLIILKSSKEDKKEDFEKLVTDGIAGTIAWTIVVLAVGFCVHLFL